MKPFWMAVLLVCLLVAPKTTRAYYDRKNTRRHTNVRWDV